MRGHLLASAMLAVCTIVSAASDPALAAQRTPISIRPGDLSDVLDAFVAQTGQQLIYRADAVRGVRSPGARGDISPDQALAALLSGTGFIAHRDSSGAIAIMSAGGKGESAAATDPQAPAAPDSAQEVVVTGLRASLQASASIKRNADQVVDSIVAEDIGKFPDNSTAAALQRVPGVQVFRGDNNEIVGPIIRGLGDIITTVNGREIFSGVGRGFAFQDLPPEALAAANVYKSNSANLLEGGVAGAIDLRLHRAFDFKGFTVAANLRAIHSKNADHWDPVGGVLIADRWDTGIGEMGALIDVSYQRTHFNRPISFNCDPRSSNHGPVGATNLLLPTCAGGVNQFGTYKRPQVNGSFQWRPTPDLEVYLDGLYAGYRSRWETDFIFSDVFAAQSITNASATDNCIDSPVNGAGFRGGDGDPTEHLCYGSAATFNNVPGLTSTQAKLSRTDQYVWGGGIRYDRGPAHLRADISRVLSKNSNRTVIVDIGKQIPQTVLQIDDDHHGTMDMPGNPLGTAADFRLANGLYQDINRSRGALWAGTLDGSYDLDGSLLRQIQVGFRGARRLSNFGGVTANPPAPGGNRVTPVASVLPAEFLIRSPATIRFIDGGAHWLTPDRDYLLDRTDEIRELYDQPAGDPAFDPSRSFFARETTYAGYAQGKYKIELGGGMFVDGLVGVRLTRTDRTLRGTGRVSGVLTPVNTKTSDTDWLPNASARLRVTSQLQLRLNYAKTLARPAFSDLNPGLFYDVPVNANVRPNGFGGNPDLKPQKSDAFDAAAEYYFGRSSYVSATAYYRNITNRTLSQAVPETIDGIEYLITRPRNTAGAKLKGVEVAGQAFFDFLPGALGGIGALANFTLADSKITSKQDVLKGSPLLGVSKYSYNLGLLYEKYGVSGRVVYTYRSSYRETLLGGGFVQNGASAAFNRVRANGRVDFSVGYDVTPNLTVSVEGTNVNRSKYLSYFDVPVFPHDIRDDEMTYGIGIRARF